MKRKEALIYLAEQHRIDRHDPRWQVIDTVTFASKYLYNAALYITRQAYIHQDHQIIRYPKLDQLMQGTEEYRALPGKVAQWVLRQVCAAWDSYFAAVVAWKNNPERFLGRPRLPKYLPKQGRNLVVYTAQAISRDPKNAGWIVPSGVPIRVATKLQHGDLVQVRMVPKSTHFVVEVIYERDPAQQLVGPALIASIDVGVNNLATITSNKLGFTPLLVNGRPLKSLNQSYNKRRAKRQAHLARLNPDAVTSRTLDEMADARHRDISSNLHTASRAIINRLVHERIGTLVIGWNVGWKQAVKMGKRRNQAFVFLPHGRFVELLTYKARLAGIMVVLTEESYTCKASFLDGDPPPVYGAGDAGEHRADGSTIPISMNMPKMQTSAFRGKRVKRGLYRAADGRRINADVNGSYNILRKAFPTAFTQDIVQLKIHPVRLILPGCLQDRRKQSRTPRATG